MCKKIKVELNSDRNRGHFTWGTTYIFNNISLVLCLKNECFETKAARKIKTQMLFNSVINQLDSQPFCFTISIYHDSTCFEHMCSSSGDQNCITQSLVSSHLMGVKQRVCTTSWLITEINILRCTVSKMPKKKMLCSRISSIISTNECTYNFT